MEEIRLNKKKFNKRLKRKRKINNRVKCHKDKESCLKHVAKKEVKKIEPQINKETKVTGEIKIKAKRKWRDWLKKILIRLKSMTSSILKGPRKR